VNSKKNNIKGREVKGCTKIWRECEIMEMILVKAKRFKRSMAKGSIEVNKGKSNVTEYLSGKKAK